METALLCDYPDLVSPQNRPLQLPVLRTQEVVAPESVALEGLPLMSRIPRGMRKDDTWRLMRASDSLYAGR